MAINYDSTVRFVGDDHRKPTSRRRAPPIQSEIAGDYSQTLNLNLNLQSHKEILRLVSDYSEDASD